MYLSPFGDELRNNNYELKLEFVVVGRDPNELAVVHRLNGCGAYYRRRHKFFTTSGVAVHGLFENRIAYRPDFLYREATVGKHPQRWRGWRE